VVVRRIVAETPPSANRIFISYRRDETAYAAGWLFDRLAEQYGRGRIFKDVDSVVLGDDFVEVITAAVGSCDVLLALIGSRWLTIADEGGTRRLDDPNDFVRLELEAALTRPVRVIPILVDAARMPRADELPPSLAPLVRRQALELSPSRFTSDTNRLLTVLDNVLAEVRTAQQGADAARWPVVEAPDAGRTDALERRAARKRGWRERLLARPRILIGAGIATVLLALLIGMFAVRSDNGGASIFEDDFSGQESGWVGGRYANDAYRLSFQTAPGTTGGSQEGLPGNAKSLSPIAPENLGIDVDARRLSAPNDQGAYGITCRFGNGRGYAFTIWGDHVSIAKFGVPKAYDYRELDFNDVSAVDNNGSNHLRAVCKNEGKQRVYLEFWVNGQSVASARDSKNPVETGTVGLEVATGEGGAIEAEFDDFVVKHLQGNA
jgi:hypothetical protein